MMALQRFEKEYQVHVYETGPDGRATIHALFNYMQDIASEHAVRLGFGREDLMKRNTFWVLSRMFAEFCEWPCWEDRIRVKTWPNGTEKLFAMRNYEICHSDGRIIASATSSWLIVDRNTKKIQRPDSFLTQFKIAYQVAESQVRIAEKLPEINQAQLSTPIFKVKNSDLDVNLHTNNVNYIKWVNDTYDLDFMLNNHPISAEINYLAESVFGDEIFINTSRKETSGLFSHSIFRNSDKRELCRMKIDWKKNEEAGNKQVKE